MPSQTGYGGYYRPQQQPQKSPLALAAAGSTSQSNPFGFQVAKNTTGITPPVAAPTGTATPVVHAPAKSAATSPVVAPYRPPVAPPSPSAASLPQYDINTDYALQQTNVLTGLSDDQANAQALKQKQQIALGYGSADLARAATGDENTAAAAAGNPSSTLAQLGQQHDRNEHDLTENLNANNLLYSGYRVNQEQQAGQDYQNALAKAAADVNGGLDTVSSNLGAALAGNRAQREQALSDAANRAIQAALANPPAAPQVQTGAPASSPTEITSQGFNDVGVPAYTSYQDIGLTPDPIPGGHPLPPAPAAPNSGFTEVDNTPKKPLTGSSSLAASLVAPYRINRTAVNRNSL